MGEPKQETNGVEGLTGVFIWFIVIAVAATVMAFNKDGVAAVGVVLLIFISAFAAGSFLGFLFGVPRVLSREGATPVQKPPPTEPGSEQSTAAKGGGSSPSASPVLQSNTNLERISDWLTTMIVGATLVQIHKINDGLLAFRGFLEETAKVFTTGQTAASAGVLPAVGPIILIFGAVTGFLYMYLNTRLFLTRMFAQLEAYLQNGADKKLDEAETRAVAEVAQESGNVGAFVRGTLAKVSQMSVSDALQLMRSALYKKDGYKEAIRIGSAIANTAANNGAYWFLLAAAFGQNYAVAKKAADAAEMQSARDNALDSARRAISLGASYRKELRDLTDPRKSDDDLAELYADDPELRNLLAASGG